MSLLRDVASGLRSLFRKDEADRELDEEVGAYLEMAVEDKIRQGMSRQEAVWAVRLERGSVEVRKEVVRSGGWEVPSGSFENCVAVCEFMLISSLTCAIGISRGREFEIRIIPSARRRRPDDAHPLPLHLRSHGHNQLPAVRRPLVALDELRIPDCGL